MYIASEKRSMAGDVAKSTRIFLIKPDFRVALT